MNGCAGSASGGGEGSRACLGQHDAAGQQHIAAAGAGRHGGGLSIAFRIAIGPPRGVAGPRVFEIAVTSAGDCVELRRGVFDARLAFGQPRLALPEATGEAGGELRSVPRLGPAGLERRESLDGAAAATAPGAVAGIMSTSARKSRNTLIFRFLAPSLR